MQKPTLIALAALSLAFAAPLFTLPAHAGAQGQKAGGKRLQKLADDLGLTDAQKAQMKPILMSSRQQMQAIQADTTLTPDARMEKMKALRKSTRQQTMAILTSDQRTKLKAIRQAKHEAKEGSTEDN